jgi:outer membrane protein OmpA-like peptidoglycan-associated protein
LKVTLIGNVYNDKTSQLLSGANVTLTIPEKEPLQFQTKTEGKFETKFTPVVNYKIATAASGFLPNTINGTIPALTNDTTIIVDIRLTPIAKELILTGVTRNETTSDPINAKLIITERGVNKNTFTKQTQDGVYEQKLPTLGWYMLTASASGFLNKTDSIELADAELSPFVKDVFLQPIEIGVTVRLKNIYFDFDKTTLKSESFVELNKVVYFLKENPTVEIEISGHTDSKGADEYNLNLSQGRSETVVNYLIDKGINASRLTPHGYGEEKPIDTNETDAGRANNRRVEFTVLKK